MRLGKFLCAIGLHRWPKAWRQYHHDFEQTCEREGCGAQRMKPNPYANCKYWDAAPGVTPSRPWEHK